MKKVIASLMSIAAGLETAAFTYNQPRDSPSPQGNKRVGFATVPEGAGVDPPHPVINEKD